MSFTDQLAVVSAEWVSRLEAEKGALGIRAVLDGDRQLIGETPTVAVIQDLKQREIYSTGMMTKVDFKIVLMIYHQRVQEVGKQEREAVELAESIEAWMHLQNNRRLITADEPDGLIIYGQVTRMEPGYANRDDSILRTVRLTWEGQSRHALGMS